MPKSKRRKRAGHKPPKHLASHIIKEERSKAYDRYESAKAEKVTETITNDPPDDLDDLAESYAYELYNIILQIVTENITSDGIPPHGIKVTIEPLERDESKSGSIALEPPA